MSDNLKELGMFQSVEGEYDAYLERREEAAKCPITGIAAEFEPSGANYLQNPYLFFDKARPAEPVFYSPQEDYWVNRKTDIIEIVPGVITHAMRLRKSHIQTFMAM